jgi:hypothetical protein
MTHTALAFLMVFYLLLAQAALTEWFGLAIADVRRVTTWPGYPPAL